MGLKDLFKPRSGRSQGSDSSQQNDALQALIAYEDFPIIRESEIDMHQYKKLPIAGMAALGSAFATIPASARTVVQTISMNIDTNVPLFIGISTKSVPDGFLIDKGLGTVGNVMRINEQGKRVIASRLRFKPLENGLPVRQTTETIAPFNPTTLMIGAALMAVDQKLDALQKTAEEILQFLKLEKQSRQRGNLNTLREVLDEYKRSCNDEKLCGLRCMDVQTIRREAQQDILFYQEQIARRIQEKKSIHVIQQAQALLSAVSSEFCEYQLACYIYAFSMYLDVMLRRDFDAVSLEAASNRMSEYAQRYTALYSECLMQIERYCSSSIESRLYSGLGSISKTLADKASDVPLLKKGKIDGMLTDAGKSLDKCNEELLAKGMVQFTSLKDHKMSDFIENLRLLDRLHNQPNSMLTDGSSLYLLNAAQ